MTLSYRYRKAVSIVALTALIFASMVTPAAAEYVPSLGRFVQRDPNGKGLVLTQGLRYHGSNPMVTVSMAYELQYSDGMNFYEYLRSNPPSRYDPSGQASLLGPAGFGKWMPSVLEMARFGGYFLGIRYANQFGGWGPTKRKDALRFAWEKAGFWPGTSVPKWSVWAATSWLPNTTQLLEKVGDLSILGRRIAGAIKNINKVARVANLVRSGPAAWLASPVVAAGAAYVGVLDSVLWTIENDF